ncbi:aquaporin-5 [Nematostella vectensis]|uniref:aquaporin-5 n=1 Tax=Nematostella vectensis TaxID=45351 RepID=UPI00138FAE20|nr:aquaporin-5 [Nematostella vectensis]
MRRPGSPSFASSSSNDMESTGFIISASLVEIFGSLLYGFLGCASTVSFDSPRSIESIALSYGILYAVLVYILAPFSGGYVNPIVTIALLLTRKVSVLKAVFYIISQITGGIAGVALFSTILPFENVMEVSQFNGNIGPIACFVMEVVLSFLFVCTVLVCRENDLSHFLVGSASGVTLIACHLAEFQLVGWGINPACALGAAVMSNRPVHVWVYLVGPVTGSTLAAGFHYASKYFPGFVPDDTFLIKGEAINLPEVKRCESGMGLESVIVEKPQPVSPRFDRMQIPDEMKTNL